MKPGDIIELNKNINTFFSKGDKVEVVADWGDLLYVSDGIMRVAIDKSEGSLIHKHKHEGEI